MVHGDRRGHLFWMAFLGSLMILVASGCQGAQQPAAPAAPRQPEAVGQAKRGGTLTMFALAARSESNYDVFRTTCCSRPMEGAGQPLLGRDRKANVYPLLAEKWEASRDGLTVTVKLRQGVKFHNKPPASGREMEAKDVVATVKYTMGWLHPGEPPVNFPRHTSLANLKSVEAVDKYTVKFTLSEPNADFINGLSEPRIPIIPDGLLEAMGGKHVNKMPEAAIGTGPFVIEQWDDRSRALLRRHPDYWEQAPDGKPYPYLDQFRILFLGDNQTGLAALRAKQIDITQAISKRLVDEVKLTNPDLEVVQWESSLRDYVLTNAKNGQYSTVPNVWKDKRVRRALFLMTDQCKLGDTVYGKGIWRYQAWTQYWFLESPSQEELGRMPGYRCDKDADRKEAVRLLTEAGYPKGFKMVDYGDAINPDDNVAWASDLNEVMPKQYGLTDFHIETKLLESAQSAKIELNQEYDVRHDASAAEPTTGLVLHSDFHCQGGRNYSGYCNAEFDRMWEQQQRELDPQKRATQIKKIFDFLWDDMVYVPMPTNNRLAVLQPYVKGYEVHWAMGFIPWIPQLKAVWADK